MRLPRRCRRMGLPGAERCSGCALPGGSAFPNAWSWPRATEDAAPEFGYFEFSDAELATECTTDDLDEIAQGGALRMAAEALYREADDAAKSAGDRAVAAAAMRRLYGYVMGEAR